jgi:hypothetical protein
MWRYLSKRVAKWSLPRRRRGADTPIGNAGTADLGWHFRSSSPAAKALAWGGAAMPESVMDPKLQAAMDALYHDVVALGDQARGWFDGPGLEWRQHLPLPEQTAVATESLATTARLMAVMAWLLDPAQADGVNAPLRRLAIDPAADGPMPRVLEAVPGGQISLATRQLVARAEALALSEAMALPAGEDVRW